MAAPKQEVRHEDEPSAVSTRTGDARVLRALRIRSAVPSGAAGCTLARWPAGFACPKCGGAARTSFVLGGLPYWQCAACAHQCSLISGTVFESSKLPFSRWFLAMQLLTQSKTGVSALELMRQLGLS